MDWIDSLIIPLYRLTADPVSGFFVGTFLLALLAGVLGEATMVVIYLTNRGWYESLNDEVVQRHNASIEAARSGDKDAYKAANKLANDAFGKTFFAQIGLGMGSLWPVFFALGFLQNRFAEIRFPIPGTGWTVGYFFIFLLLYILARILLNKVKYRVPGMDRVKALLDESRNRAREMTPVEFVARKSEPERLPDGGEEDHAAERGNENTSPASGTSSGESSDLPDAGKR